MGRASILLAFLLAACTGPIPEPLEVTTAAAGGWEVSATFNGDSIAFATWREAPAAWIGTRGNPNNPELIVKVLDGCKINGHHWVYVSGATDQKVRVTISNPAWPDDWHGGAQAADVRAFECDKETPPPAEVGYPIPALASWQCGIGLQPGQMLRSFQAFTIQQPDVEVDWIVLLEDGSVVVERMAQEQARARSRAPGVVKVEQDQTVTLEGWSLDRIDQQSLPLDGAPPAFDGTGRGVHIYVEDTGLDTDHPEFAGRVGEAWTAYGGDVEDDKGHGTHVAGIAAGTTTGIAREATVHPVRVFRGGTGTVSAMISGVKWATAHRAQNGWPAVLNMSLQAQGSEVFDVAICNAVASGMWVVVAAGNNVGEACTVSPARVHEAITVGATTRTDQKLPASNRGPCVQVWAPGEAVYSTYLDGGYSTMSGSSMAAPHVTGAIALLLERGEDPRQVLWGPEGLVTGFINGARNRTLYVPRVNNK